MNAIPHRGRPPFLPPLRRGFSLIEVMLALAIASVGFVTMLGLMPHGLQMVQSSARISAEARIKQKLVGELLTAPWDQLTWNSYGPKRYFNDQGIEIAKEEAQAAGVSNNILLTYVASVQMPAEPLDVRLPAAGGVPAAERFLRRAKICIVTSSNPDFDFESAPKRLVRSYTAIFPQM